MRNSFTIRAIMKAVRTSETSVHCNETKRHYIAEISHLKVESLLKANLLGSYPVQVDRHLSGNVPGSR
jgi:hypothetical protein